MTERLKTLAEAMAIAVLRGEMDAALALADKLTEERDQGTANERIIKNYRSQNARLAADGYAVYQWPEFRAFALRLGVMVDHNTWEISFAIREGEVVEVNHRYVGFDAPQQGPIDTTTLHNETFSTAITSPVEGHDGDD